MRTTTSMIYRNVQYDINKVRSDLLKVNKQISSGKQMSAISDDPANLVSALGLRTDVAAIEQYQANLQYGKTMATAAETALTEMKELMMTANTLALQANSDTLTATDRENMAVEVQNLYEQAIALANTQVSGKYIFGGFRTTGYTDGEPAPFVDGLASGYGISGNPLDGLDTSLTGTAVGNGADLASGDLVINGEDMGIVDLDSPALTVNGLNMGGADNLKSAVNANSSSVTASLTTLYAGGVAAGGGSTTTVDFSLNGVHVSFTTGADPATDTVAAINAVAEATGVTAVVGDGTNGGVVGEVVLRNSLDGDESAIEITGYSETGGTASTGLADMSQAVGPTSNTGQISLTSSQSFTVSSSNFTDDTALALIGLAGGAIGFGDEAGDGELIYGYRIADDDLAINGVVVGPATADANSTVLADTSAAAKAAAINAVADRTGVSATVTPAVITAMLPVEAGTIGAGDLVINGVDIFATSTAIADRDSDNALLDAINSQSDATGVVATRNSNGSLVLSAVDGRNVQIATSAVGEDVTSLNGKSPAEPGNRVYFGRLTLASDDPFSLSSAASLPSGYENSLAALGLDGGSSRTGEEGDAAGDGELYVRTVYEQDGNVRYCGDLNDPSVKITGSSTLVVGRNGQGVVMDTNIFTALQSLKDALTGENHTAATGMNEAEDTAALLNSGTTGLEQSDEEGFVDGSFTVTLTDHAAIPAREFTIEISVNTATDSLEDVAGRLDAIPGLDAGWDADGRLAITSSDAERYSFALTDDTSNFLKRTGITGASMQGQALDQALADIEASMEQITSRVSGLGATYNRIEVQSRIYDDLEVATRENLSVKEDTDLVEAVMELEAKTTAYEAALSAASKVMELSLVDFL